MKSFEKSLFNSNQTHVCTCCTYDSQFWNPTAHLSEAECHLCFFTSNTYAESEPPTSLLSNLLKQLFHYHYVKKEGVGVLPF